MLDVASKESGSVCECGSAPLGQVEGSAEEEIKSAVGAMSRAIHARASSEAPDF